MTSLVRFTLCAILVAGSQAVVTLAEGPPRGALHVPPVPPNIQVPAGHSVFLAGHAIGTQNFICLATNDRMEWRFTGRKPPCF